MPKPRLGRPPGSRQIPDLEAHTVTIPQEDWAWLGRYGRGNASAGLRRLITWARMQRERPPK